MKSKSVFIFFIMFQFAISQQTTISGNILDKETSDPIYGVAILMGDNYLGFTDIDGSYKFNIDKEWINEIITFKHLSFEEIKISVIKLLKNSNILLIPKINSLDEVLITNNPSKKRIDDIIKTSVKKFDEIYIDYPYWSTISYKHLLYLDGTPHAFMQLDGHILMVGSQNNNPFIDASLVPDYIRRTKESDLPIKSWFANSSSKKFSKTQLGYSQTSNSWTDFRFVELMHPLSKKGERHFNYFLNKTSDDNENFIIIDFDQIKEINIATRWLDNMSGQVWLNKNDLTLHRLITTYRFERMFLISYDIFYKQLSDKLFPNIVKKTKYSFKSYNEEKSKITISSVSYLENINIKKRENYRKKYMNPWYSFSNIYDEKYWDKKKISEPKYLNGLATIIGDRLIDSVFVEGANTKEYNENFPEEIRKSWESNGLALKKIMQKDLKD